MSPHRPAVLGLVLAAGLTTSAVAQPTTEQDMLTAIATGRVKVQRPQTLNDKTIARAVARAGDRVVPEALRQVRIQAVRLGSAAGVRVGPLLSVTDVAATPFGPYGDYGADGTFGPGRYCGNVRSAIVRVSDGRRRVVGHRTRRTCRVPSSVSRTVAATYRIDGPLPRRAG